MDHWTATLNDHPVFESKQAFDDSLSISALGSARLDTSSSSRPEEDDTQDAFPPKQRAMVIRGNEVIVAVGSEIRVATMQSKSSRSFTTLRAPELGFKILQISLNPSKKLLAVAGARRLVVLVLPRAGGLKSAGGSAECKALLIGQGYHGSRSASPIVDLDWHPWGEAGASLLVLTKDAKFREYDVSADPEEPLQTIAFIPERKSRSYGAEDPAAREAVSFTLGSGDGDWSPFTLYVATRSGDVYANCPFMPVNATLPSGSLFALDGFVAAKQHFLSATYSAEGARVSKMSVLYDQQRRYVTALLRQLPGDVTPTSLSRPVSVNAPPSGKRIPSRQGPFVLRPAPSSMIDEDGDMTDIQYLTAGSDTEMDEHGRRHELGIMIITSQDGHTNVCLDLDKVEARWDSETASELPTFLLYETIDLGFSDIPNPSFDLFDVNHPVLVLDPVHDDILYMYHAFGVHSIDLKEMLQDLSKALLASDEENQAAVPVEATRGCIVRPIMTTSSPSVEPVTAVAVPTDSFSTSSMVVLTANQRARVVPLASRSEDPLRASANGGLGPAKASMDDSRSTYISALVTAPFVKPEALQKSYADLVPQITAGSTTGQLTLDAATLRQLSITVERFRTHLHGVQLARQMLDGRATLQQQEFARQQAEYGKMIALLKTIQSKRQADGQRKLEVTRAKHVNMLSRTDRILKRLMLRASPELNEHETRWFEELSRMKQEVLGMDKYDDRSLSSKAELLRLEVDRLTPQLEEAKLQEPQRWQHVSKTDSLGASQAFQLGTRTQYELADIQQLEKQITGLAARLDVNLSKSPDAPISTR